MENKLNKNKYKNAVLYFVSNCNNRYLGKTKLNKLFYYLDFISYRDNKVSVTGDYYIHDRLGPVPNALLSEIIPELRKDGKLEIKESETKKDGETYTSFSFCALEEPNTSCFNRTELKLLKDICNEFKSWSSDKIIEQTHFEAPWFYSESAKKVDFKYAYDIDFFKVIA